MPGVLIIRDKDIDREKTALYKPKREASEGFLASRTVKI